jgi:quinol monooxygenase YgiN
MTTTSFAGDFRHVVLFQFKATATPDQIKEIETAFAKLPQQIDTIKGFEWGLMDNAETGLNQGFSHGFLVTFKNKADLEKYLPHAAHQTFVEKLKPILEKALVFDYEAKEK